MLSCLQDSTRRLLLSVSQALEDAKTGATTAVIVADKEETRCIRCKGRVYMYKHVSSVLKVSRCAAEERLQQHATGAPGAHAPVTKSTAFIAIKYCYVISVRHAELLARQTRRQSLLMS